MKIPLLTKLFHRRTRSDTSAVLQAQAQARGAAAFSRDDLLPASLSLPAIPEDALCDAGFVQPQNYHSSRQDPGPLFSFAPIPPTLVTQHMSLLERIQALEQENAHIQELNQDIRTRMETTSTRLAALRSEYYTERATAIVHNRALKHAQISRKSVAESLIHLEKTCDALVKMTVLVDPVLVRAKDSILTGNPAEQAFAESLQAAASDPRSPWSSLFPAIQEQRMTSHHANALTLASKTNHQLESVTMRRSFWKHLALGQTPVVFSMTPSASALSSLGFGSASHRLALTLQRRLAVEALLQRRRQEQQVRRTRMVTHPGRQLPSPSMTSSNLAAIVQLPPISPAVLKLPPLASQTFKQELIASYSSERFSLRLPKTVPSHSISLPSTQAVEDSRETLPSPQKPSSFQAPQPLSTVASIEGFDTIDRAEAQDAPDYPKFHLPTRKLSLPARITKRFSLSSKKRHNLSRSSGAPQPAPAEQQHHFRRHSMTTVPLATTHSSFVREESSNLKRHSGSFTSAQNALASLEKFVGSALSGNGKNTFWRKSVDLDMTAVQSLDGCLDPAVNGSVLVTESGPPLSKRNSQLGTLPEEPAYSTNVGTSRIDGEDQVMDISFKHNKPRRTSKRSSFRSSLTLTVVPSPAVTDGGTMVDSPYTASIISDPDPTSPRSRPFMIPVLTKASPTKPISQSTPAIVRSTRTPKSPSTPTTPKPRKSTPVRFHSSSKTPPPLVSSSTPPGSPTPKAKINPQVVKTKKSTDSSFRRPTLSSTMKATNGVVVETGPVPGTPSRVPLKSKNGSETKSHGTPKAGLGKLLTLKVGEPGRDAARGKDVTECANGGTAPLRIRKKKSQVQTPRRQSNGDRGRPRAGSGGVRPMVFG